MGLGITEVTPFRTEEGFPELESPHHSSDLSIRPGYKVASGLKISLATVFTTEYAL